MYIHLLMRSTVLKPAIFLTHARNEKVSFGGADQLQRDVPQLSGGFLIVRMRCIAGRLGAGLLCDIMLR